MKLITLKELEAYPPGTVYCDLDENVYAECFTVKGKTCEDEDIRGFARRDLEPYVIWHANGPNTLEWRDSFYRPPDYPGEVTNVIVFGPEDVDYLVGMLTGRAKP